jgi:hypothetical protein
MLKMLSGLFGDSVSLGGDAFLDAPGRLNFGCEARDAVGADVATRRHFSCAVEEWGKAGGRRAGERCGVVATAERRLAGPDLEHRTAEAAQAVRSVRRGRAWARLAHRRALAEAEATFTRLREQQFAAAAAAQARSIVEDAAAPSPASCDPQSPPHQEPPLHPHTA